MILFIYEYIHQQRRPVEVIISHKFTINAMTIKTVAIRQNIMSSYFFNSGRGGVEGYEKFAVFSVSLILPPIMPIICIRWMKQAIARITIHKKYGTPRLDFDAGRATTFETCFPDQAEHADDN